MCVSGMPAGFCSFGVRIKGMDRGTGPVYKITMGVRYSFAMGLPDLADTTL